MTDLDCDEAEDYVISPRDLVFRPDNMDETVPHTLYLHTHFQTHYYYCGRLKNENFRINTLALGNVQNAFVRSMQRSGTEAIRTQIQPSNPKGEITNITNSQITILREHMVNRVSS